MMCKSIALSVVTETSEWDYEMEVFIPTFHTVAQVPNYTGVMLHPGDAFQIEGKKYEVSHRVLSLFTNEVTFYVNESWV